MLMAGVLVCSFPAAQTAKADVVYSFTDVGANHWALTEIEAAMAQGWIDGYGDGKFRPDRPVMRAEFVKMVAAATGLVPGSAKATWFVENHAYPWKYTNPTLKDVSRHWLNRQGYFEPAESFGYVLAENFVYTDYRFKPDAPINRTDMTIILDRALGRVYPAKNREDTQLPFADQVPEAVRGYVKEAVEAGVIKGREDNTFGWNQTATRAEAAVMVHRMLQAMKKDERPELELYVRGTNTDTHTQGDPVQVELPAPIQEVNGTYYVPARALARAANQLYGEAHRATWLPLNQTLVYEYGVGVYHQAGNNKWDEREPINAYSQALPAPARISRCELLIPVNPTHRDFRQVTLEGNKLIINADQPMRPNPS